MKAELKFLIDICNNKTPNQLVNWDRLKILLIESRLFPVIYKRFQAFSFLPKEIHHWSDSLNRENSLIMLSNLSWLNKIEVELKKNGIKTLHIKGPTLSQYLYNDPFKRSSRDVDFLVDKKDLNHVSDLLLKFGFKYRDPNFEKFKNKDNYYSKRYHLTFEHESTHQILEVHWRFFHPSYFDNKLSDILIASNYETVVIKKVEYHILADYMNLCYLTVHGGVHRWKRLFWLYDILTLINLKGEGVIVKSYFVLKKVGYHKYLFEALMLIDEYFGTNYSVHVPEKNGEEYVFLKKSHEIDVRMSCGEIDKLNIERLYYLVRSEFYLAGWSIIVKRLLGRLKLFLD